MPERNYTGFVKHCQICSNPKLTEILSLGHQPIVQYYLTKQALYEPESTYPLTLVRCGHCGLLQLNYIIDPRNVFPLHYPYRTGLTNMLIKNFQELAETTARLGFFKKGDLIVDMRKNICRGNDAC